jgi:hypothetical protein
MVPTRMVRKSFVWSAALSAIALALAAAPGCRPPAEATHADHEHGDDGEHLQEHHDMPTDYRQAIAQIRAGSEQIAKAIHSGDLEAAHAPLDEIDPIIGQLMPIAKQSGVPRRDWEAINVARRELRAEFDKLHASIDAGERPDYAAAKDTIEERLKRLQAAADQLGDNAPAPSAAANAATPEEAKP